MIELGNIKDVIENSKLLKDDRASSESYKFYIIEENNFSFKVLALRDYDNNPDGLFTSSTNTKYIMDYNINDGLKVYRTSITVKGTFGKLTEVSDRQSIKNTLFSSFSYLRNNLLGNNTNDKDEEDDFEDYSSLNATKIIMDFLKVLQLAYYTHEFNTFEKSIIEIVNNKSLTRDEMEKSMVRFYLDFSCDNESSSFVKYMLNANEDLSKNNHFTMIESLVERIVKYALDQRDYGIIRLFVAFHNAVSAYRPNGKVPTIDYFLLSHIHNEKDINKLREMEVINGLKPEGLEIDKYMLIKNSYYITGQTNKMLKNANRDQTVGGVFDSSHYIFTKTKMDLDKEYKINDIPYYSTDRSFLPYYIGLFDTFSFIKMLNGLVSEITDIKAKNLYTAIIMETIVDNYLTCNNLLPEGTKVKDLNQIINNTAKNLFVKLKDISQNDNIRILTNMSIYKDTYFKLIGSAINMEDHNKYIDYIMDISTSVLEKNIYTSSANIQESSVIERLTGDAISDSIDTYRDYLHMVTSIKYKHNIPDLKFTKYPKMLDYDHYRISTIFNNLENSSSNRFEIVPNYSKNYTELLKERIENIYSIEFYTEDIKETFIKYEDFTNRIKNKNSISSEVTKLFKFLHNIGKESTISFVDLKEYTTESFLKRIKSIDNIGYGNRRIYLRNSYLVNEVEFYDIDDDYSIMLPITGGSLINEGTILKHCVSSYRGIIETGSSIVLYLRKKDDLSKPFYTIEVDTEFKKILQVAGSMNKNVSELDIMNVLGEFAKEFNLELPKYIELFIED